MSTQQIIAAAQHVAAAHNLIEQPQQVLVSWTGTRLATSWQR